MVTYTPDTIKKSRGYGLSPEEMAFVDLVSCGWDKRDAYIIAMHTGDMWTPNTLAREAKEILARAGARQRLRELRKGDVIATADDDEENDEIDLKQGASKENMLRELIQAKKKYKLGSKEWLEISKMIAEITRMKQEEVKTEDTTVHFYLPLTCSRCKLYAEYKK